MKEIKYLILLSFLCAVAGSSQTRRIPVPNPDLIMYGYENLTGSSQFWPNTAQYKAEWSKVIQSFTVIEGGAADAALVERLRAQGKVFAYRVSNTKDNTHNTVEDFVTAWSKPFLDTLHGQLPGGFDAICIDEFHSYPDGTEGSRIQNAALKELRSRFPDRLIFASGVWKLADGGQESAYGRTDIRYDDTLNAINKYADVFVLENFHPTSNPQLNLFFSSATNLQKHSPGLLRKTVFCLYISQSQPFVADDNKALNFAGFLEQQLKLIRTTPITEAMSGVAYWIFYRARPQTIDTVVSITKKYFE